MSQATDRVLDVLELFLTRDDLGVSETAQLLGVDKSTTSRLLSSLERREFLMLDPSTRRYRPGAIAMRLAGVLHKRTDLRSYALPLMRSLCESSEETVSLQVRFGDERMCLEQVESPRELRRVVQLGVALPLYPGATGKTLTAFGPDELGEREIQRLWPGATADEVRWLAEDLREVRRRGYAMSVNERVDGIAGLAAPIIDYDGRVVAALAVSGPSMRWTLHRMREFSAELRGAAATISRQLGAKDYPVPEQQDAADVG